MKLPGLFIPFVFLCGLLTCLPIFTWQIAIASEKKETVMVPAVQFKMTSNDSFPEIRDRIRAWRQADSKREHLLVEVLMEPGIYYLNAPVDFGPKDGHVHYRALGKNVLVTRGKKIDGWRKNSEGLLETTITEVSKGKWWFDQLYINNQRAHLAESPNDSFYYVKGPRYGIPNPKNDSFQPVEKRSFYLYDTEASLFERITKRDPKIDPLSDIQIKVYHAWSTSLHRLQDYDSENRAVLLTGDACWKFNRWGGPPHPCRYRIYGVREALDAPGEFLLERSGKLTYYPRVNETVETITAFAPNNANSFDDSGFFRIAGEIDSLQKTKSNESPRQDLFVEGLHFEGIHFSINPFTLPFKGLATRQSGWDTPDAITIDAARDVRFIQCRFTHLGGGGVWFRHACTDSAIKECLIDDIGAIGIKLGTTHGGEFVLKDFLISRRLTVENCLIRRFGRIETSAVGIWLASTSDNVIRKNEITDGYYSGISAGWMWGYGKSQTVRNQISYNLVHDLGQGYISDMGGIYTLGISTGTVIANNVVTSLTDCLGIYADQASSEIVIENNLVYNTDSGGFYQHYGRNNLVRNNIFAYNKKFQIRFGKKENHLSFTAENNIVIGDQDPLLAYFPDQKGIYLLKNNLYQWTGVAKTTEEKEEKFFNGQTLKDWQKKGNDSGSILGTPNFVNEKQGDFHFVNGQPNADVRAIGFKPFDPSEAGVELSVRESWGTAYSDYSRPQMKVIPPLPFVPVFRLNENFEALGNEPLVNTDVQTVPQKKKWKLRISPLDRSGKKQKPVFESNELVLDSDSWQELHWLAMNCNGNRDSTIDIDNFEVRANRAQGALFVMREDFSKGEPGVISRASLEPKKDEKAWSLPKEKGNRFLRMTDGPFLARPYDPSFLYTFRNLEGTLYISFDLRMGNDARFQIEGREFGAAGGYKTGPMLKFQNQTFINGGRPIGEYETDLWYRIEMEVPQHEQEMRPFTIEKEKNGNHFLRVHNNASYGRSYEPMFTYKTRYKTGKYRIRFRIRLPENAEYRIEGRTYGSPYETGPSILFHRGNLIAGGRSFGKFPANRWLYFELTGKVGEKERDWAMTVRETLPNGSKGPFYRRIIDLKYPGKGFSQMNWFGFMNDQKVRSLVDIDDIQIEPIP